MIITISKYTSLLFGKALYKVSATYLPTTVPLNYTTRLKPGARVATPKSARQIHSNY